MLSIYGSSPQLSSKKFSNHQTSGPQRNKSAPPSSFKLLIIPRLFNRDAEADTLSTSCERMHAAEGCLCNLRRYSGERISEAVHHHRICQSSTIARRQKLSILCRPVWDKGTWRERSRQEIKRRSSRARPRASCPIQRESGWYFNQTALAHLTEKFLQP
ncbi:hypothetical protein BDY19DRAFT_577373 [Irpex rosettiformis]|uniref:Uncharacterized protein n=1 Tax=Irpex rosettiformis TaxID=378272 RepID=A0ACB8UCP0_9APHY|nr:hypothetical protein BDY19DRAFT_577373 [Irpex rosettiformis]